MHKCLIFLLALFSLSVQARANWTPYKMDHERFMNLEEKDKDTLIIRRMEIMVELESKYAREVEVSGYSFERFQKYVQILNHLQSLIISDAVAADPETVKFSTLVDKEGGCIYGGWASQIIMVNKTTPVCVHPSKASDKNIVAAYKAAKSNCKETAEISCNPKVFGYKKSEGSTPFCVETGPYKASMNKAHNVSYECMRSALSVEKTDEQDSKAERLKAMKEEMKNHPTDFDDVQKYIFKTCACRDTGKMSTSYKKYIRPHRTCFGMMNSLRNFENKECSGLNSLLNEKDLTFAKEWNEFFDKELEPLPVPPSKEPQAWDERYRVLIDNKSVQNYCKTLENPPVIEAAKTFVCETTCAYKEAVPPAAVKKTISCQITKAVWKSTKDGKDVEADAMDELENKTIENATAPKTMVKLKDKQEKECLVKVIEEPAEKKCSISVEDVKDDKTKSVATLSFPGYPDGEKQEAITWTPAGTPDETEKSKKMVFVKTEADQPLTVTYQISEVIPSKEPRSCVASIPKLEKSDDTKPTLDVEAEPAQPTSVKLNAKVKVGKDDVTTKLPAGSYVSWFRSKDNGTTREKAPAKVENKEDAGTSAIQDQTTTANTDETTKEPEVKVPEGEFSKLTTVTVTRMPEVYQTCASLIDAKGVSIAGPICKPIPAIAKPGQNNNNNNINQNGPKPTFMTPQYNTRRQGVR
jgi:hypothetical protein